ncbi:H-NS histone family protein [Achromobacter anxifer]
MRDALRNVALEAEIQNLRRQAASLRAREKKQVLSMVVGLMHMHEITADEVILASKEGVYSAKRARQSHRIARSTAQPMYRHPHTGQTWSGRGRPPRWLIQAEETGTARRQYLITHADESESGRGVMGAPS